MKQFTNREMVKYFSYGAANGNSREAAQLYEQRSPHKRLPNYKTFVRLHPQLCETGSFLASWSDAGRARTARKVVVEQEILHTVADQPSTNTRVVGHIHGLPQSTTWRMLKGERLNPYHFQRIHVQEKTVAD